MSVPRQTLGTPGSTSNPAGSPHGSPSQADPPVSYPISRYASGDQNTDQSFVGHRYLDTEKQKNPRSFSAGSNFRLSAQEESELRASTIPALAATARRAAEMIQHFHARHQLAPVTPAVAVLGAWHAENVARENKLRQSPLWSFCRVLKGCEPFAGLSPGDAATVAEAVLKAMPSQHPSVWVDYLGLPPEDCGFTAMASTWSKVTWAEGDGLLVSAARRADVAPPRLPDVPLSIDTPLYRRFLGMVHYLYLDNRQPVAIPCREFGKALGVSRMTVSRLRGLAVADGLLVKIKPHRHNPGGKGEATRYAPVDPTQPPATTNYYDDPRA